MRSTRMVPFLALLLAACRAGNELDGAYEATTPDGGSMRLEFVDGQKVAMTLREPGGAEERKAASYLVDGNHVTVQVPDGMPLVLARNGGKLQANILGEILVFVKR